MRKMILPLEREGAKLISANATPTTGSGPPRSTSPVTRPVDFGMPWVVNPVVERFGLVYDITDFSATMSMLGRAQKTASKTRSGCRRSSSARVNSWPRP